ncbi:MAG: acyl-CoA thioesterase [Verrucomicrobiae bacterium]|nr:acyl-CoA thioesterase [Verrucomicrobiae bacterium]
MSQTPALAVYCEEFDVPQEAIDGNGHVNNVAFVQWMQDVATRHFAAAGGVPLMRQAGATWVARSHRIDYLAPAFAGDRLQVRTWVADFGRARSLRRYEFRRARDGVLLVRAETDWVFVRASDGRPCAIPDALKAAFVPVPDPPQSQPL